MSLELCILASGSAGNAALLRTPGGCILIDAGIGPRASTKRLEGTGVTVRDIRAIILTHLDSDHFTVAWLRTIAAQNIQVFCHAVHIDELNLRLQQHNSECRIDHLIVPFILQPFDPLDGITVHPIALAHDRLGTNGFVIDAGGIRIGYATDLGHVPSQLFDGFRDLHVLALESNYDVQMQMTSGRPWFLKQRIMGGAGHLSNDQALAAIQKILDHHEATASPLPSHIVLLHRSRDCNCPNLVRRVFSKDRRIASRLTLANQYQRSDWLRPRTVEPSSQEQLTLAWG